MRLQQPAEKHRCHAPPFTLGGLDHIGPCFRAHAQRAPRLGGCSELEVRVWYGVVLRTVNSTGASHGCHGSDRWSRRESFRVSRASARSTSCQIRPGHCPGRIRQFGDPDSTIAVTGVPVWWCVCHICTPSGEVGNESVAGSLSLDAWPQAITI